MASVQLDASLRIVSFNPAAESMAVGPLRTGDSLASLVNGADLAALSKGLDRLGPGMGLHRRVRLTDGRRTAEATAGRFADGGGILIQLHDDSRTRRHIARLEERSRRDALTGLPNRSRLLELLSTAITGTRSARKPGPGLLFVDLDRFKQINDALGHASGDEMLVWVARTLRSVVRPTDIVGRMGGDEFVIIAADVTSEIAEHLAQRIVTALSGRLPMSGGEAYVGASVGVALAEPSSDSSSLLGDADTAMYRAKQQGGSRYVMFTPAMRHDVRRRHHTEIRLRHALEGNELTVVYQPVVGLTKGRTVGVEALLRWSGNDDDTITVQEAITVAEESSLIDELGSFVLGEALRTTSGWAQPALEVAVNVSPRQLIRPGYVQNVLNELQRAGVPPERLCLEVTETALAESVEHVANVLGQLRARGIHIAIDDFGTGHASLTYLARFPVDTVKIDKSFVAGLGQDPASAAIVGSIVTLAHALKMRVVAEGIESLMQLELLLESGCDSAQGFLLSRPLPAAQAGARVATDVPWPVERRRASTNSEDVRALTATAPARRYRLLLDLAREVTGSLDLDRVLASAFVALRQLLPFTGGSIQLVDGEYIRLAATDPPATPEALATRIPIGQGIGGRIVLTGQPRYIADILADPEVTPHNRTRSSSGGVRSYYGVPLIAEGRVLGLIQIDSTDVDAFSEDDRIVVLAFTPIVAAAVQNAHLFEREARLMLPEQRGDSPDPLVLSDD